MKIERQTELRKVLSPVVLPKMAVIEQHFPDDAIQDCGYGKIRKHNA